jgi:hypothetical protein
MPFLLVSLLWASKEKILAAGDSGNPARQGELEHPDCQLKKNVPAETSLSQLKASVTTDNHSYYRLSPTPFIE